MLQPVCGEHMATELDRHLRVRGASWPRGDRRVDGLEVEECERRLEEGERAPQAPLDNDLARLHAPNLPTRRTDGRQPGLGAGSCGLGAALTHGLYMVTIGS